MAISAQEKKYRITIDGPAASGKSTAAEMVAKRLGFARLDSGMLYRALTYMVIKKFDIVPPEESTELRRFIEDLEIQFDKGQIYSKLCKNQSSEFSNITEYLRTPIIDKSVVLLAKVLYVREKVHSIQFKVNEMEDCGLVIDGRDIGTVVFPNAFLKIFITASAITRAERRAKQTSTTKFDEILKDIEERDYADIHRMHGPLKKAPDAVCIENDKLTLEETVDKIVRLFEERKSKQ